MNDTGKMVLKTAITSGKSMKVSAKFMREVEVLRRGKCYLTPFTVAHIDEVASVLSKENLEEISILGFDSPQEALLDMVESSDCYIARLDSGDILFVGGLWYAEDAELPQMFAMFSSKLKENFTTMARGSKMLLHFFERGHDAITMTILTKNQAMVQWAAWLGFEPVGVYASNGHQYIDFVRCNPNLKSVYDDAPRPAMH
jgi:hypothetical protein